MKKIRLAFDVDGVFLNYGQALHNFLVSHYGLTPKLDFSSKQWFMKGRFDSDLIDHLGFKNIEKEFEKAGLFNQLEVMPEIDLAKELFNSPEFDIFFVTSISEHLHDLRLDNLQQLLHNEIRSEQLFCITPPTSKKAKIKELNPHFFIEDNLNNLAECFGEHHSIWINLNERLDAYDQNHRNHFTIHEVSTFNEAAVLIQQLSGQIKNI